MSHEYLECVLQANLISCVSSHILRMRGPSNFPETCSQVQILCNFMITENSFFMNAFEQKYNYAAHIHLLFVTYPLPLSWQNQQTTNSYISPPHPPPPPLVTVYMKPQNLLSGKIFCQLKF